MSTLKYKNPATGQFEKLPIISGGSSGSGTSDYSALTNKPSINGVELTGNKTAAELGINGLTAIEEQTLINEIKSALDW